MKFIGMALGLLMGAFGTLVGFAFLVYFITLGEVNLFLAVFGG